MMKSISIKFTDHNGEVTKEISTCSLKTGIMDAVFEVAEKAEEYEKGELGIKEAKEFIGEIKSLIVEAFGRQFSLSDLNQGVEQDEMMRVFKNICSGISNQVRKN